MKFIKNFTEISLEDIPLVGGKNASLGQMIQQLTRKGIKVPGGFAITAKAYWYYLEFNNLLATLKELLAQLTDSNDLSTLQRIGLQARTLIEQGTLPDDLADEILNSYKKLSKEYNQRSLAVAVRSSATAEDLPEASFAGQQETYLNVHSKKQLLHCCKKSFASLFTDRAIIYRMDHNFDHFQVGLSIGVQKMIRSDLACSGVMFTLDTETGFKDLIMINSSYGLGEAIVQGFVNPDEFHVHKPTLAQGYRSIIKKACGSKQKKMIYATKGDKAIKTVSVPKMAQHQFTLSSDEILSLASQGLIIEEHYSGLKGAWMPMDIEWAKDGTDGQLYIIQARPETVHANTQHQHALSVYHLKDSGTAQLLLTGQSIGKKIASGKARVVQSIQDITSFEQGDVLVTTMTDPDWVPIMKKAAAIVTERGGRTCHAAIVSRELGIPAVIGADGATKKIAPGQEITIDCSKGQDGYVYSGQIPFTIEEIDLAGIPKMPAQIMVNCADPDSAFTLSFFPVDGVGLARIEFIISNWIRIHPMAAIEPDRIANAKVRRKINELAAAYESVEQFFVDSLAQGIGTIAAAFYPRPVIVRFSDFKTNEYANLLGGSYFEPHEDNPMLGLRGASRYFSALYKPAFALECAAMKQARTVMGLHNIKVMVPFVRTVHEAQQTVELMQHHGLKQGDDGLEIIMMCEVPSNVILIDDFCRLFDGFSIGSNDLTQMTLAVDRDSSLLAPLFDERDEAVKKMMQMAIEGAHRHNKPIGICGQAPSDYPEIADFLIQNGIDSLSLNADSVLAFILRYKKQR